MEHTLASGYTLPELHAYPGAQMQSPSTAHPGPGVIGLPLMPSTWSLHSLEKMPSGSNLAFTSKNLPSFGYLPLTSLKAKLRFLPQCVVEELAQRYLLDLVKQISVHDRPASHPAPVVHDVERERVLGLAEVRGGALDVPELDPPGTCQRCRRPSGCGPGGSARP